MNKEKIKEWICSAPTIGWLLLFFIIPSMIILVGTFRTSDGYGGFGSGWTLNALQSFADVNYIIILVRTIVLSLATATICVAFAIPTTYWMARLPPRWRTIMLTLFIIPFSTSTIIRIFAWKQLLHAEGLVKHTLVYLGWCKPEVSLLYNDYAVLFVMIYTSMPFAILPLYAVAEKFDFQLIEAAADLGASRWKRFREIYLSMLAPAILNTFILILIPTLSSYAIPDLIGGVGSVMLGNVIAQSVLTDRNLPQACALSLMLLFVATPPILAGFSKRVRSALKTGTS
jgi:spermidine/putrescine transport system permease protein